jgi:hypothetical protein
MGKVDLLTASKRTNVLEHLRRPASIIRASSVQGGVTRGISAHRTGSQASFLLGHERYFRADGAAVCVVQQE